MNIYSIPYIIGGAISLFLGSFVAMKNRTSATNRIFFLLCSLFSIWLLSYAIAYSTSSDKIAMICAGITCTAVIFVGTVLYHFIVNFLGLERERIILYFVYLITFILGYFFITTDYFLAGVYKYFWGYFSKAGKFHPYYLVFQTLVLVRAYYLVYITLKNKKAELSSLKQIQIKYFLAAAVLLLPSMIDYVPKYGVEIYPFGFVFILFFLSVIAYAIVRHQLMEIEIIIKKTLVFAGLLASVFAMLLLPTFIIQEYLTRGATFGGRVLGLAISGIIIILAMRKIENFLINVTDRYLFQKKYDYKELLKTFTSEVLTVLDLDKLVRLTVDKLSDIIKITSCGVLLLDKEKNQYELTASQGIDNRNIVLGMDNTLATFLNRTRAYLSVKHQGKDSRLPARIIEDMNKLKLELAIPLIVHDEMIGLLTLGKKKSDEDYTQDDMDILLPLSRTLAIAISNAEMFEELGKTQAEAAQQEKMAVIGTLSAGINHEICNPLGIARGQCEAFLLNIKDGLYKNKSAEELLEKAQKIMEKVMHETDRATAITKRLSSFAKPSRGVISNDININNEIDEVLALVGYELKLDKINIVKEIDRDLPFISADKKQLQEVFFNLIRNAAQAIEEKGKITIRAEEKDDKINIEIEDTGHGISEDKIGQIFNPFYTTKDPGKGMGLGLFIVRQVVERNRGRISARSRVNGGTTFILEFPVAKRLEGVKG